MSAFLRRKTDLVKTITRYLEKEDDASGANVRKRTTRSHVPPSRQMNLYRGVVLAWKREEVEASDLDLDSSRDQAKRWIEQHVPMSAQEARSDGAS